MKLTIHTPSSTSLSPRRWPAAATSPNIVSPALANKDEECADRVELAHQRQDL
jgi:hypothetical protein